MAEAGREENPDDAIVFVKVNSAVGRFLSEQAGRPEQYDAVCIQHPDHGRVYQLKRRHSEAAQNALFARVITNVSRLCWDFTASAPKS